MRNKLDALLSTFFEPKDPVPQLAIEVSAYSVKLLEMARSAGGVIQVLSIGEELLPWGSVSTSGISDLHTVSSLISMLVKKARPKSRLLITSVTDSSVSVRDVFLPNTVLEKEIEDLLLSEVATQLGASADELVIDYEKKGPGTQKNDIRFHVISCRKDTVDEVTTVLSEASVSPMVMDVDSNALFCTAERAAQLLSLPEQAPLCVIDCGAAHSAMYIYKNKQKIFSKEVAFGGYALTQEVQIDFNMEYREAEKAKVSNQLPAKYTTELLPRFLEQFIVNVERCFDSFEDSRSIQSILLLGGASSTPTLQQKLQKHFDKKVFLVDPLKGFDLSRVVLTGLNLPSFSVVTGLLLRGLNNND